MNAAVAPAITSYRLAPIHLRTLEEEIRRAGLFDLLADESLTDLVVNEDGSVFASGFEGSRWCGRRVSSVVLEGLIGTIAGLQGQVVHEESPILEASLPLPVAGGRMRVEGILPRFRRRRFSACAGRRRGSCGSRSWRRRSPTWSTRPVCFGTSGSADPISRMTTSASRSDPAALTPCATLTNRI